MGSGPRRTLGEQRMRVLYFGTYDRGEGRNTILAEGLRAAGVAVDECHVPLWRDTQAKLRAARMGPRAVARAARVVRAWRTLKSQHRRAAPYDVMVVGSTAHMDLPLASRLSAARGRPLVFDPLVSIVETVRDRGLMPSGSLRLRALSAAERRLFRLPDIVLVDSATHGTALQDELQVRPDQIAVVPAGAPSAFRDLAVPFQQKERLRVVYFGQYIPLHGLEHVLRAAATLGHRADIRFELVGQGQQLPMIQSMIEHLGLSNVRLEAAWLPVERLAATFVAPADICLGVFGAQPKADRVVPFKVYTALASMRPVVTGDTTAVRELLRPGEEVWTVPTADPGALAAAIEHLADRPVLRSDLAAAGQRAYDERFAPQVLGQRLRDVLEALLASRAQSTASAPSDRPS